MKKQIEKIVEDFKRSGLSRAEYARQKGLSKSTLSDWCKKVGQETGKFLPLVQKEAEINLEKSLIEIEFRSGIRVRTDQNTSELFLKKIRAAYEI